LAKNHPDPPHLDQLSLLVNLARERALALLEIFSSPETTWKFQQMQDVDRAGGGSAEGRGGSPSAEEAAEDWGGGMTVPGDNPIERPEEDLLDRRPNASSPSSALVSPGVRIRTRCVCCEIWTTRTSTMFR
jgi:hypothetical protein